MPEDKYVLRDEWQESKGKINEKIKDVDYKHTNNYNQLLNKIDQQTLLQKKSFESQEKSEKHLEKISESLGHVGDRVRSLEYDTVTNQKDIEHIRNIIKDEAKGNRDIIVAWIGVVGVVLGPVITFVANLFFS
ncbi:hypothetical protein [Staphylococcus auricularis]|uniref:hypothetical protein n=1 Tax=Staphylococcus auricularis TaxID=29379 RepID=UPI0024304903|nr:hypothetical protein [Staphylococcus auricularis]